MLVTRDADDARSAIISKCGLHRRCFRAIEVKIFTLCGFVVVVVVLRGNGMMVMRCVEDERGQTSAIDLQHEDTSRILEVRKNKYGK